MIDILEFLKVLVRYSDGPKRNIRISLNDFFHYLVSRFFTKIHYLPLFIHCATRVGKDVLGIALQIHAIGIIILLKNNSIVFIIEEKRNASYNFIQLLRHIWV